MLSWAPGNLRDSPPAATCAKCGARLEPKPLSFENVTGFERTIFQCDGCAGTAFELLATGRVRCPTCHRYMDGLVVLFPTGVRA